MNYLILFKEIYTEGFKNLGHKLVKNSLKIFSWFCFISFLIVLYAFIFRLATGFAFD